MPVSKNRRKKPKHEKNDKKPKRVARPVASAPEPVPEPAPEPVSISESPIPPAGPPETLPPAAVVDAGPVPLAAAEPVAVPEPAAAPTTTEPPRRVKLTVVSSAEPAPRVEEAAAQLEEMAAEPPPPARTDPFGRDPEFERRALKALEVLYRHYFRVEAHGIEHVPSEGPAILVANHSGAVPWDGAMLKCALSFDHPSHRSLRPLSENVIFHFPFLGVMFNRFGAVRACQENAEALLDAGEAVAVFPEGVKGLSKLFRKRYQLQRFGRGGFVKLAMRMKTPIIPVAIVGAEETNPLLARIVRPVEPLGIPYVPVTPTFPLLGPLGLLPLPTKWKIEFGEPVTVDESQVTDELAIERLTEDVRSDIQGRIDRMLSQRKSWFA